MFKRICLSIGLIIAYTFTFCFIPALFFWPLPDGKFWGLMILCQLLGSSLNSTIMWETKALWRHNNYMRALFVLVSAPLFAVAAVLLYFFGTILYVIGPNVLQSLPTIAPVLGGLLAVIVFLLIYIATIQYWIDDATDRRN